MDKDKKYIGRCLELAIQGQLFVAPNPMVGCVIVHNGVIVAEGFHEKYGEAHAEVNAFANLPESIEINECTVYVNLEPCSFYGKTPPCASLLIDRKPGKVVIGTLDPHPKVAGRGVKMLLEAGIEVKVGILEQECLELNKVFFKAHTVQKPYITLKWAETKDGYIARSEGDNSSAKISSSENDEFVHQLRATHQAIVVGAKTANHDDPLLNLRHSKGSSPIKVILSKSNTLNRELKLFSEGRTIIYTEAQQKLSIKNVETITLNPFTLDAFLDDLIKRDIHSVLVEGGSIVLNAFLSEKLWDEAIILKSNKVWSKGIKAPWIDIPSIKERTSFNDRIKYFKP